MVRCTYADHATLMGLEAALSLARVWDKMPGTARVPVVLALVYQRLAVHVRHGLCSSWHSLSLIFQCFANC